MLDQSYLVRGLDLLCRAHTTDYFRDGHKGGAIISAYFFCAEEAVEEGVSELIAEMINGPWLPPELRAPFPAETPDPGLLDRIAAAVYPTLGELRQAGHNVILPALALKAFHQRPDTITPSRVEGLCTLVEAFDTTTDVALDDHDEFPDLSEAEDLSDFVLREYLRTAEAFIGRGQGWTGHLLTLGRALMDLRQVGQVELARRSLHTLKLYVKRARMGPLDTDKPIPEHAPTGVRPLELAYWRERRRQDPALGHCFKYPYGFYGLMGAARDADLKRRCLDMAFRVF